MTVQERHVISNILIQLLTRFNFANVYDMVKQFPYNFTVNLFESKHSNGVLPFLIFYP